MQEDEILIADVSNDGEPSKELNKDLATAMATVSAHKEDANEKPNNLDDTYN